MKRLPSSVVSALVGAILVVFLVGNAAWADIWGADVGVLTGILAQGVQAVQTASNTLGQLRRTYEETKRVAGYADDAYQAYQHFSHYNSQLFKQDMTQSLETAFPDAAYFQREANRQGPWAQGSGEVTRSVRLCLGGVGFACREASEIMTLEQTQAMLARNFGETPKGNKAMAAVDYEAAQAIRQGQAQTGRSGAQKQRSDVLMKNCADTSGDDSAVLASCQAAGAAAQVESLKAQADIADGVSETNRLLAIGLEQRNAEDKRELESRATRRATLLDAVKAVQPTPTVVKSEGLDLTGGAR